MRWRVTLFSNSEVIVHWVYDHETDARRQYESQCAKVDRDPIYWAGYSVTFEQQVWVD